MEGPILMESNTQDRTTEIKQKEMLPMNQHREHRRDQCAHAYLIYGNKWHCREIKKGQWFQYMTLIQLTNMKRKKVKIAQPQSSLKIRFPIKERAKFI